MSYTVIATAENGPVATVAPSVLDALKLVNDLDRDREQVTIASETGWILTVDELEALAKA